MNKQAFIEEVKPLLKKMGYRKVKNYWYRNNNDFLYCIFVEGSQWDKNNYYVQTGISFQDNNIKNPTQLHWFCRHRCEGKNGELNILPDELLHYVESMHKEMSSTEAIMAYLEKQGAVKAVNQFFY